ncbi:MAG: aminopeptidase P family protein [Candidatus Pacebacteria bacterium]|nr:aminopeptidase P family protein [Candidatus Paceibacterota bacterium]
MSQLSTPSERKNALRELRGRLIAESLAGMIIPLSDDHLTEFVPDSARDLAWLTGFSGSAGTAVVLLEQAALFSDGRYSLQMESQTDPSLWQSHTVSDADQMARWIQDQAPAHSRIGFDPRRIAPPQLDRWNKALKSRGVTLVPLEPSPLDSLWHNRPATPATVVWSHPAEFNGEDHRVKLTKIATELRKSAIDAAVITSPESIAWLLNIRAGDSDISPIALSFAVIHAGKGRPESVEWFIDSGRCDDNVVSHLGESVRLMPPDEFLSRLDQLAAGRIKILCDPQSTNVQIMNRLQKSGAEVVHGSDPCALPKSIKNPTELEGSRAAHRRDGLALARLLAWLDGQAKSGITELTVSAKVQEFRRSIPLYHSDSFETISAAAANAALPHYHPSLEHDEVLKDGSIFLLDCGAQYHDGTTDITRTVWIASDEGVTPPAELRSNYTRVLKGHIAMARAIFPIGTTGSQLDILARQFLWRVGRDFDHGTGHGVGSFLSVHEGPQRISKLGGGVALQPGMIISNEPGYYRSGQYGIRIENLVAVVKLPMQAGFEREMLGFETLSLAPIDLRLVDLALLDAGELDWINGYHQRVWESVSPELQGDELDWLKRATKKIECRPKTIIYLERPNLKSIQR